MRSGYLITAFVLSLAGAHSPLVLAQEQARAAEDVADLAGVHNPARARINYMLNCQGCHGAAGAGTADGAVPTMQGHLANFLKVAGGREFLVRVPGSANAAMSDAHLAEVLNWMLFTMSAAQMPEKFLPYDAAEVGTLRAQPLQDVIGERDKLVGLMATRPSAP